MSDDTDNGEGPTPKKKPWAVLVYMVADDPRGGQMFDALAQREADRITHGAMSDNLDHVHVALQVDFRTEPFVWRRIVNGRSWIRPEEQSASPQTLYGFFEWARAACPADRYMLVLWGHSQGPFGFFADDDAGAYVAQSLTVVELRDALTHARESSGQKIDIIAFKDCYIGTLEVAFELRDLADFLLTSQGDVPAEGWPYEGMFTALRRSRDASACAIGVYEALEQYYAVPANRGRNRDVPMSLLDTSKVSKAVDAFGRLSHQLVELGASPRGRSAVRSALTAAAAGDPALLDLRHLCHEARRMKIPSKGASTALAGAKATATEHLRAAKRAAGDLERALVRDLVLRHASRTVRGRREFNGVSVFCFPANRTRKSLIAGVASRHVYSQLQLSEKTNWPALALASMPMDGVDLPPVELSTAVTALPFATGEQVVELFWDQVRRSGLLERLQLDGVELARRALLGLSNLGPKDKPGGLGPKDKPGGLGPKDKPGGLGPAATG
jgi:hypothetical protein